MSSQEHAAVDWAALQYIALSEDLGSDQRWSTWRSVDRSSRGPKPRPGWLVTSEAALDTELGLLKTGKEADVFLIERAVPGAESCLLAAKRYRAAEHRLFHRASSYTEGRRGRDSRENRAVRLKSGFGRQIEATRWSQAEFATLKQLWTAGASALGRGARCCALSSHILGGASGWRPGSPSPPRSGSSVRRRSWPARTTRPCPF